MHMYAYIHIFIYLCVYLYVYITKGPKSDLGPGPSFQLLALSLKLYPLSPMPY